MSIQATGVGQIQPIKWLFAGAQVGALSGATDIIRTVANGSTVSPATAIERVASQLNLIAADLRERPTLPTNDLSFIRALIAMRGRRSHYLAANLFGEPCWDILLDLTRAQLLNENVSISSLCIAANVPNTTALRYIHAMVTAGLLVRLQDSDDRRRSFLQLSPSTFERMLACLAAFRMNLTEG